jgi:predicted AAA+ superfamily ATPase
LTTTEIGSGFDLDRVLRFGTLPPVVTQDDATARDILRAYADTYLREEIQAEALVRSIGGFARFLDVAAAQSGELLNLSGIARDAALPVKTVQNYFEILEDTLIGFRLDAWRASPRGRMVAHPRFYLFDPGITSALTRRLGAELDSSARGRLFEQWIVLECRRLIDYAQSEARIFFWRTNTGAEVDLLVERHGKLLLACGIKSGRRVSSADLSGLRSFAEVHPEVPRIVVADVAGPFDLSGTEVLPWRLFLERFEQQL